MRKMSTNPRKKIAVSKIPLSLHAIAADLNVDLSGYERDGEPIDWPDLFGWMRHWADNYRSDKIEEIEQRYAAIVARMQEIETQHQDEQSDHMTDTKRVTTNSPSKA